MRSVLGGGGSYLEYKCEGLEAASVSTGGSEVFGGGGSYLEVDEMRFTR